MKKKLEADLISIAHRILKLKNKSEVIQLHAETQKLYEKLSVLKFLEENFNEIQPTIGKAEVEAILENEVEIEPENLKKEKKKKENSAVIIEEKEEIQEVIEESPEEFTPEIALETAEEPKTEEVQSTEKLNLAFDKKEEIIEEEKKETGTFSFDDLLGQVANIPVFEKVEEAVKSMQTIENQEEIAKSQTISNKTIAIGLNDRIGFEKQLFNGSGEDLNRVLSQINTHTNFEESQEFINQFVKPDYNNWEGKEEYETRFLEIIENKFK
jgi:hypothetical protein